MLCLDRCAILEQYKPINNPHGRKEAVAMRQNNYSNNNTITRGKGILRSICK